MGILTLRLLSGRSVPPHCYNLRAYSTLTCQVICNISHNPICNKNGVGSTVLYIKLQLIKQGKYVAVHGCHFFCDTHNGHSHFQKYERA